MVENNIKKIDKKMFICFLVVTVYYIIGVASKVVSNDYYLPYVVVAVICCIGMISSFFMKKFFPMQTAYVMCLFYGVETLFCTFAYNEYSVMLYFVVMMVLGIMYQNKRFLIYSASVCICLTVAGEAVGCNFLDWNYEKAGLSIFIVTAIAVSVIMAYSHVHQVNAKQFEQITLKCDEINDAKDNIMSLNKITLDSIEEMTQNINDVKYASKELDSSVTDSVTSISTMTTELLGLTKIIHGTQLSLDMSTRNLSEIIVDTEKSLDMTKICNGDVQNVELNSGNIEKLVEGIREDTSVLSKEISNVNDIIDIIKDISDEISLLSLNAMIEASRAGEFGKGFAVVAKEMQGLSDSSLRSLNSITEILALFVERTGSTITGVNQVNEELINQRTGIDNATKSITDLSKYMAQLMHKINDIVANIEKSIHENSKVSKQITDLSDVSQNVMFATKALSEISTSVYEKSEKTDLLAARIKEEMQRIVS